MGAVRVGTWVGYTGGRGRVIPGTQPAAKRRTQTAERAPEALQGLEWVVWVCSAPCTSAPTPAGPGPAPAGHSLVLLEQCPTRANMARFRSIFSKVRQNRQVSPKSHQKAYVSPYFQNGLKKSPLEILRFPFSLAFSGKELMGLFWPGVRFYVQNDEVSPDVHTPVPRSVRTQYPLPPHCGVIPHWVLGAAS